MNFDDDDFDFDDLSEEEKREIENEMQEMENKTKNHPLFKKASEICTLVTAIVESLPEEGKEMYESTMMESAYILAPKLAGAMGSDSWLICMSNASIIRYHADYLLASTSGLKYFTNAEADYVALMRKEMHDFQVLFKEWVQEFNKLEREEYEDEWGLFIR